MFFDIETTGLSWRTSHLYMIGCAYYDVDDWILQQWFLEKPGEEKKLLEVFAAFLKTRTPYTLIHYNGITFDIPYLRNKYRYYGIEDPLVLPGLDLYKQTRPLKKYLYTDSLKQRDLETCFGLTRDDDYSGGELIGVYQNYLRSGDDTLLRCLWQHNYEDVRNLLPIYTGVSAYTALFSGQARILEAGFINVNTPEDTPDSSGDTGTAEDTPDRSGDSGAPEDAALVISLALPTPLPRALSCAGGLCSLRAENSRAELTVPVCSGELRHYFSDYKNYYYLPDEDMAIHKSVGSFVDPAHRKKATADTCYQKVSGSFLPQADEIFSPAFRHTRKEKISWFRTDEIRAGDQSSFLSDYVRSLLAGL